MTTIDQQITFVEELRESYDNEQRERIIVKRTPQAVAELLRDIHENLLAIRLMQLTDKKVPLCNDCNQPIKPGQRVAFGVNEHAVVVSANETVCERCTQKRMEAINSTVGIP